MRKATIASTLNSRVQGDFAAIRTSWLTASPSTMIANSPRRSCRCSRLDIDDGAAARVCLRLAAFLARRARAARRSAAACGTDAPRRRARCSRRIAAPRSSVSPRAHNQYFHGVSTRREMTHGADRAAELERRPGRQDPRPVRSEPRAATRRSPRKPRANAFARSLRSGSAREAAITATQEHGCQHGARTRRCSGEVGVEHHRDPAEPDAGVEQREQRRTAPADVLAQPLGEHRDRGDRDQVEEELEPLDPRAPVAGPDHLARLAHRARLRVVVGADSPGVPRHELSAEQMGVVGPPDATVER